MPPGVAQDQWEDVTPGPVVNAASARTSKGADEWEDVGTPQTFAPGSYQKKPGGPVLTSEPPTTGTYVGDAARGALSAVGVGPAKPGRSLIGSEMDAGRQLASGLSRSVSQANEEAGRMTHEGRYGPAALAMTIPNLEAHGAEAIAAGLEHGGKDVLSGDPETMAHGAGEIAMNALPVAEVGPRNLRELSTDVKDAVGRAARVEPTVDNTSTRGNLAEPKKFSSLKPGVKAVASVAKMVGGPEVVNAVVPEHPVKIGPFSRLSSKIPVSEPEPEVSPAEKEFEDTQYMTEKQEAALSENEKFDRKAKADALKAERDAARAAKTKVVIAGEEEVSGARKTGSEGRPATWPNAKVLELARHGNRDAITQIAERQLEMPENARYVMGDPDASRVIFNPREVTKFAPDSTAVRNVSNAVKERPSSGRRIQIVGEQPEGKTVESPQKPIDFGALPAVGRTIPQVERPVAAAPERIPERSTSKPPVGSSVEQDTGIRSNQRYWEARRRADLPSEEPTAVQLGPQERRGSVRDIQGQDLMRTARLNEIRQKLGDPKLDARDRAILETQFNDIKANPFEKNELGGDLNRLKVEKKMTREEAEAATEARKEGRNARFSGQDEPANVGPPATQGPTKPPTQKQVQLAKMEDRPAAEKAPRTREPREELQSFDPETIEQAKSEVQALNEQWKQFPKPGRFIHNTEDYPTSENAETTAYGISSMRPNLEITYPWLKNLPKITAEKLSAAIESGKGVEYTRLLNEAGKHIQAVREANAPLVEEFGDQLEAAAKSIEGKSPELAELAQTLRDLSAGKYSGSRKLASFLKEKLNEAAAAAEIEEAHSVTKPIEAAEGDEERDNQGSEPRQGNIQATELGPPKPKNPFVPGEK